jgi:hypothetical protein
VRLRQNGAFPCRTACDFTPKKFSLRLFDHFTLRELDPEFFFASRIFCPTPMAAHFGVARTTDSRG